ncbi:MAG: AAA family ATPase, partial [Cyanobacteria bacterium NC_groundwater_1444_Ag_S-0.65um_54_12]|nr:AAA family ATPase [Cyanobacteria bacterium NC_groundwater_1444_Ag_S-0.65um_54_12]
LTQHGKEVLTSIKKGFRARLRTIFNAGDIFGNSGFELKVSLDVLVADAIKRPFDFRLSLGQEEIEMLRLTKPGDNGSAVLKLSKQPIPDLDRLIGDFVVRHLVGLPQRRNIFLMPAERNGLHLFYRELSSRRVALLHHATREKLDIGELFRDVLGSRYAEPIAHYIDWLNELSESRKKRSQAFHSLAEQVKTLASGRYDVDAEGNINFTPYKLRKGGSDSPRLGLHVTSSTVKSLFGLWFYLEHQAKDGDVLMIDEPELNLHPSNQRALARLLTRLVNQGIRVVLSTHSDYLVREINSLIMLSRPNPEREALMRRFEYEEEEIIRVGDIGAFLISDGEITQMEVTEEEGIIARTFDEVIHQLNETSDEIYYAYQRGQN